MSSHACACTCVCTWVSSKRESEHLQKPLGLPNMGLLGDVVDVQEIMKAIVKAIACKSQGGVI